MQHKLYRRERPKLRKYIEEKIKEGFLLEDLARGGIASHPVFGKVFFAGGVSIQARKMLEEKQGLRSYKNYD